jgi:holo-[acyl-carrier protein] synthase
MSILGIGNDILEISRMKKIIEKHGLHFLCRLFSKEEQKYCSRLSDPSPCYAGKFAAKEAVVKALGTGFGKEVSWKDIEILNKESGKPEAILSKKTNEKFNNPKIHISISHSQSHATAIAIWED